MKKLYNKSPVLWGILFGQGLFLLFILFEFVVFEFWLVNSGIGVIVDSCIRVVFGVIALLFMRIIYGDKFGKLFTAKIPKSTWLYCIPFFLYLGLQFLYLPTAESLTASAVSAFLLSCVQQIATGFWEEAASKGLVMSGMLSRWKNTVKGRIGMVFLAGVLFGTLHILNVLFNDDIIQCLWNALYSSAFGVFLSAIYLKTENITLCMVFHAVWDVFVRIPNYFCVNIQEGALLDFIYIAQDVLEFGGFIIVAIIICIRYKPKNEDLAAEIILEEDHG